MFRVSEPASSSIDKDARIAELIDNEITHPAHMSATQRAKENVRR